MLRRILRDKIAEAVNEAVEQLNIKEILEEAAEKALADYYIEDTVIDNIESLAQEKASSMLSFEYDTWVEDALDEEFDIEDYE